MTSQLEKELLSSEFTAKELELEAMDAEESDIILESKVKICSVCGYGSVRFVIILFLFYINILKKYIIL